MRILIITILFAMLNSMNLQAQRLVQGQKAIEVSTGLLAGKVNQNYFVNLALTSGTKYGNYWIWAAEYTRQNTDYKNCKLPIETYTAEMGYSLSLLSDPRKVVSLNAALMAVGGYETINRGKTDLPDGSLLLDSDHFIYGVGGRLTLETYISDRFVVMLHARAKAVWGTDLKQLRPSAGIGLRFNF